MAQISKEYAEALFLLACEAGEGQEAVIYDALTVASDTIGTDSELSELLASPAIPLRERLEVIETVFEDRLPEYVLSFLLLLCEKGRIRSLPECKEEYRKLLDIKRSVTVAKVTAAVPLTEEEKTALKRKLQAVSKTTVELSCSVDPAILGGIIVEWNGTVMDGSLRHRLQEVKEVMNQ